MEDKSERILIRSFQVERQWEIKDADEPVADRHIVLDARPGEQHWDMARDLSIIASDTDMQEGWRTPPRDEEELASPGIDLRVGRKAARQRVVVVEGSLRTQVRQSKFVRLAPFPPQRQ
jgi:hypothetical protein